MLDSHQTFCRELFVLASDLRDVSCRTLGYPVSIPGEPPTVGSQRLPTWLMVGTESQFAIRKEAIADDITVRFFDSADHLAWKLLRIKDTIGRFFRYDSDYPALIWTSPSWLREHINHASRQGLLRDDRTLKISEFELPSCGGHAIQMGLGGSGETFSLDPKKLVFHYPEQTKTILKVSRTRREIDLSGRCSFLGYEEGICYGTEEEKSHLEQGIYRPNNYLYAESDGIHYYDFFTLTLARVVPMPKQDGSYYSRNAWVRFIRFTIHPDDINIVVLLAGERRFDRFVMEHAGMRGLLERWLSRC